MDVRFEHLADLGSGQVTPPTAYAVFDGLFLQALLRQLAGDPDAARDLRAAVTAVISRLVPVA